MEISVRIPVAKSTAELFPQHPEVFEEVVMRAFVAMAQHAGTRGRKPSERPRLVDVDEHPTDGGAALLGYVMCEFRADTVGV